MNLNYDSDLDVEYCIKSFTCFRKQYNEFSIEPTKKGKLVYG